MAITHADALGRPLVTACKDQLSETSVSGLIEREYVQSRHVDGKNLVFSLAFPLVWEEVARVGGSTILMQYEPPICVGLQNEKDYHNDLEPYAYFATGNYGNVGILQQVREGLARQFHGVASPTLLPDHIEPDHLFAYAYMFKHLVYDEREGRVAHISAGIRPEDFILDLPVTSADDRLVIASMVPGETLAESIERALLPRMPFSSSGSPAAFALERYRVPKIHFDFTWKFRNTSGRYVLKVDEFGATVLSEAAQMSLPLPGIIVARPGGASATPILVVMPKRNARRPYFAAWLQSNELLIPDPVG
jgi:hypothetical protein